MGAKYNAVLRQIEDQRAQIELLTTTTINELKDPTKSLQSILTAVLPGHTEKQNAEKDNRAGKGLLRGDTE